MLLASKIGLFEFLFGHIPSRITNIFQREVVKSDKATIIISFIIYADCLRDPTKPVLIPTTKQKKDFSNAIPSFTRNVMGSSAGAGSGEFHVYRHLRRKEYARQKHIQQKSKQETLDDEYQQKLENNRLQSEEKTAKKRAKRLKKKQMARNKAKMPKIEQSSEQSESESDDDEKNEDKDDVKNEVKENETDSNKTQTNESDTISSVVENIPATDNVACSDGDTEKAVTVEENKDIIQPTTEVETVLRETFRMK